MTRYRVCIKQMLLKELIEDALKENTHNNIKSVIFGKKIRSEIDDVWISMHEAKEVCTCISLAYSIRELKQKILLNIDIF